MFFCGALCGRPASAAVPKQKTTSAAGAAVPAGLPPPCPPGRRSRRAAGAAVPASAPVPPFPPVLARPPFPPFPPFPQRPPVPPFPPVLARPPFPPVPASAAVPAKGDRARRANGDRAGRVGEDPDGTGGDQHAVGVADRVDVEADEVALVVDAVDGGGADAARVRDGGEPSPFWSR